MDKPMTFIEWCSSDGNIPYAVGIEEAYEAGQQSQQAKVEELQKRVDALEEILKKATEVVELNIETVEQSRDKAIDMHERNYSVSMLYFLKPIRRVLQQALKGDS